MHNVNFKSGFKGAPAELKNKFNTIIEAAAAYAEWQNKNRPVGRPSSKGVNAPALGTLREMLINN